MSITLRAIVLGFFLTVGAGDGRAEAQSFSTAALDATVGWIGFADDGVVSEAMVGGAGRLYVTPRLAVGPEILYIRGNYHSHFVVTGNMTFDFVAPSNDRRPRATPYIVLGAGAFRTREQFPFGSFTSTEGAFTAGGGVRVPIGERVIVGAEARVGWEPHTRINGVVGWRLGR